MKSLRLLLVLGGSIVTSLTGCSSIQQPKPAATCVLDIPHNLSSISEGPSKANAFSKSILLLEADLPEVKDGPLDIRDPLQPEAEPVKAHKKPPQKMKKSPASEEVKPPTESKPAPPPRPRNRSDDPERAMYAMVSN